MRRHLAALACFALCTLATPARAFTALWSAAAGQLPTATACSWTLSNNAPGVPVLSGGALRIATASNTAYNQYYLLSGAALAMPSDSLVIEFGVRYVSGSTTSTTRAPISLIVETSPYRGTALFIGANEMFFNSGNASRGGTASVVTSDAVHDYRLVIVGTALRIYRDGVLKLTGTTFFDSSSGAMSGTPRILWGEGSSLAYGTSDWTFFQHNAATTNSCEPVSTRPSTWGRLKLRAR